MIIRLKWGQTEYHGRLISVDSYMNVQLSNTEEFIDGKSTGTLGQVLIRYVGVLRKNLQKVVDRKWHRRLLKIWDEEQWRLPVHVKGVC